MTNITRNEAFVLNAIAHHEMTPWNTGTPDCDESGAWEISTYCWAEDFTNADLNVQQVKGVLGSLVQKGLVTINEYDARDNVVSFTPQGFRAWKAST